MARLSRRSDWSTKPLGLCYCELYKSPHEMTSACLIYAEFHDRFQQAHPNLISVRLPHGR